MSRHVSLLLIAFTMSGCATSTGDLAAPVSPAAVMGKDHDRMADDFLNRSSSCNAAAISGMLGMTVDDDLRARVLQLSGARLLRVIGPTDSISMDFREDRLNLEVDREGTIRRAYCG
ncbi:I78 family peptidase inhibitor [Croceicoccus sp. F390]|uniref:I78 family peptidase inhibitor n=1 Tax=Croceicoccus esteveae TaxID=3075597 RepID=A0ABU2ZH53_9SPHN|nr:I78 family peptidase inhibitor [Croceicoccus sp. F390]MDT0575933.1 I78 family peptidase inhibitor [Croceicoccus sp. F390]